MVFEEFTTFIVFYINGKRYQLDNPDPTKLLIEFLRENGLTGTKLGCGEGGCGACTVMLSHFESASSQIRHRAVNSCLTPLCAIDNMAVTTVEGIGSTKEAMHVVQERLAALNGSQCGFCTPGFVMALYAFLRNNPKPTAKELEDCLEGNLCRCTGYRPILDAAKTFAVDECCSKVCPSSGKPCHCADSSQTRVCDDNNGDDARNQNPYPKQALFPYELRSRPFAPLCLGKPQHGNSSSNEERSVWYRPETLDQLMTLKSLHQSNLKFVNGNTELGIETRFKGCNYSVLCSTTRVPELNKVTATSEGVMIGAAVTLADLEHFIKDNVCESAPESWRFDGLKAIQQQLKWFAGPQIRNVASVVGNIATASPISDLNPILSALGCTLNIISKSESQPAYQSRTVAVRDFFLRYRVVDLRPDEIIESVFIPYFKNNTEFADAFKQSRRRADDIAIVSSGMWISLHHTEDSVIVQDIRLSFGGMAPTTISAVNTEKLLIGRQWNSENTLNYALQELSNEFQLSANTPGGMVEYRRSLVLSFFLKFFWKVQHQLFDRGYGTSAITVPDQYLSILEHFDKPVSKGSQVFEERANGFIGKPIQHAAANVQATGEARFVDDIPSLPNELHGYLVTSTKPHANILSVDPSKALEMPGVVGYYDCKSVPGSNVQGIGSDEEIFASKTVFFNGQTIGVIVAETLAQARHAAKAVVVCYEELPPILSIEEAIEKESFFSTRPPVLQRGDVDAYFNNLPPSDASNRPIIVQGDIKIGAQEHFYMEPMAAIAIPGENDELTIYSTTQDYSHVQCCVAAALGRDAAKILSKVKRLGGGFGGKETKAMLVSSTAAVAANAVGRPVRILLDREVDMVITGKRHPFYAEYKVAVLPDGTITALDVQLYCNGGHSLDLSAAVLTRAMNSLTNAYFFENTRISGKICKTNLPSNTAYRGFGSPQAHFIMESIMDHALHSLNQAKLPESPMIDSATLKFNNLMKDGQLVDSEGTAKNVTIGLLWSRLLEMSDFEKRKADVEIFNTKHQFRKRGIAIMPMRYGLAFGPKFLHQASALVHIYRDGSVAITHGGVEMGQGIHTKCKQIAATELGIPIEKVTVSETSSDKVPNASPSAASLGTDLYGGAVLDACKTLKQRLDQVASAMPPASTFAEIASAAYFNKVQLTAQGFFKYDLGGIDPVTNHFNYLYSTYGAAVTEAEIDTLTGDFHVVRTDIVMDIGQSINPAIDIGQIEGAFVQGMGLFTMEETVYGDCDHPWVPKGALFTRGPGTYKIPSSNDVPVDLRVRILENSHNPVAVHGSKGIGEPPLCLSVSVLLAIKEGIRAARRDAHQYYHFILDAPATAERIRMLCVGDNVMQHILHDGNGYRARISC